MIESSAVERDDGGELFSVAGRVALVTGAGSGLGRAVAMLLARNGADVAAVGRSAGPLEDTAQAIRALRRRSRAIAADVTRPEQCEEAVKNTVQAFGGLDILVNCVGGGYSKAPEDWTPEEWRTAIDRNLSSVWFMATAAAREMLQRGKGTIVNISTSASTGAVPIQAPYCAAKAAVDSLTRSLAAAWTPRGIRVNGVAPGAMHTPAHIAVTKSLGLASNAVVGSGNALGRIAEPEEVAPAVLFLASDASSYCSGETVWVNGGPRGWTGKT